MTEITHPPRYLADVYDESDPDKHVTYRTEISDGVVVIRTSADVPPAWTGAYPCRIPADAPGLSTAAIHEINKLLAADDGIPTADQLQRRLAELDAQLASGKITLEAFNAEHDRLFAANGAGVGRAIERRD